MLLRRIVEHVKTQNWTAVGLDFIIVVVGVFIGIQVSNWNAARGERSQERFALLALREDLATTTAHVRTTFEQVKVANTHLRKVARFADGLEDDLPISELDEHILRGVYLFQDFNPTMVTFDELRDSGRLSLINDVELRKKLQELASQIEEVRSAESNVLQVIIEITDPYLLENYDVRGFIAFAMTEGGSGVDWLDPMKERRDMRDTMQTPQFISRVLYRARMNFTYRNSLERLTIVLSEADQMIVGRLDELGGS